MFKKLTDRLSCTIKNIKNRGRLTENNIQETLCEVRTALLESDVALSVVRNFIYQVKKRAIGHKINTSLQPGQMFIKIVKNELIHAMGSVNTKLCLRTQPPAVILLVGLQGVGKTTTVAKLGKFLKEKNKKKVLVVSTDIYRPAAITQLNKITKDISIDSFPADIQEKPIDILNHALKYAQLKFYDVVIVDTAGRLHVNTSMMKEIKEIHTTAKPIETLFIVDAMTGQDAANTIKIFNTVLPLTGAILTKADSDSNGGAALSIRHITGIPIKFIGVGEKTDDLEAFYPDRMASRILGMGDMLSFIEEVEKKVDYKETEKLRKKFNNNQNFDLTDFLSQLKQIRNIGNIENLLSKLPNLNQIPNSLKLNMNDHKVIKMEAIIHSMTPKEREHPEIIKVSRKCRIANGSGTKIQEVNHLLKQFHEMQNIIKQIKYNGITKVMRSMKNIIKPSFINR
ncbi:Signal recognition particle protein [Candidatus Ecksteinia adelgidicola]|nr:Signal recognition particle protein [Candidatus Ecksteinia adelgidicola]